MRRPHGRASPPPISRRTARRASPRELAPGATAGSRDPPPRWLPRRRRACPSTGL